MNVATTALSSEHLTEALTQAAEDYFLSGRVVGVESSADFRSTVRNLNLDRPHDGKMIWAAGLLAADFVIKSSGATIIVHTPSIDPEEALEARLFLENWHLVAPTIIDMGIRATSRHSQAFDQDVTAFVLQHLA